MKRLTFALGAMSASAFFAPAHADVQFKIDTNFEFKEKLDTFLDKLSSVKEATLNSNELVISPSIPVSEQKTQEYSSPSATSAYADIRPFDNNFVISSAIYVGDKAVGGTGKSMAPILVGDSILSSEQIHLSDLKGSVWDSTAYAGFGLDSNFSTQQNLSFRIMAGAMISNDPNLKLATRDALYSDSHVFIDDNSNAYNSSRQDLKALSIASVIDVGMAFKF